VRPPPSGCHADQLSPDAKDFRQSALSAPRTNTSSRPGAHDAAAGADDMRPPSRSQPDHVPELNHRCQRASSAPRTNTSSRPGPHDTTAGCDRRIPPRSSVRVHEPPAGRYWCTRAPAADRMNTSSRPGSGPATAGEESSAAGSGRGANAGAATDGAATAAVGAVTIPIAATARIAADDARPRRAGPPAMSPPPASRFRSPSTISQPGRDDEAGG
jgi:hypothetical protein